MAKTPKPSGCSISRSGSWFTLTWKIAAKNSNDGQKRRWYVNGKHRKTESIGKTATKTSVQVTDATISSVKIEIQDDQKKAKKVKNLSASDWAGATFSFTKPPKSVASMSLSDNYWNACTVSWGHEGNAFTSTDNIWFVKTECETTFHSEQESDSWTAEAHTVESSSFTKQESSLSASSQLGYVRKYRFRIRGKYGYNDWAYCSHYYSTPYVPVIKSALINKNESGGINCSLVWNSPTNDFHPIDYSVVQYGIAVPGPGMSCPSGISWSERPAMLDAPGDSDDGDSFYIDSTIDEDYCLFARVVNIHDNNRAYSTPAMAEGIVTRLSAPSGFSVTPDYTTNRVAITISNESAVPDSNIAIVFRSITGGIATEQIIGIVPNGVEAVTLQCPNLDTPDEWSLGAFAFVGDYGSYILTEDTSIVSGKTYYTRTGNEEQTATAIQNPTGNPHTSGYYEKYGDEYFISDDTTVDSNKTYYTLTAVVPYEFTIVASPSSASLSTYYELDPAVSKDISYTSGSTTYTYSTYEIPNIKMRSQTQWQGGDIPRAPTNVMVQSPREGVALVTWDWAWKSADIAELSWSDHDDAWESTDQPETYRITNAHAAKWSIYGLESGTTWYIRVRLIKTTAGGENPGPWSDPLGLDMASAPNAPILTCSKLSVTHEDAFTVSWEYESTDGTDQTDAVLRAASLNNSGEVQYGDELRTDIGTNRSIDLIPDDLGWETGNKYGFVLKVISESGKHSEWSEPVFITVAEPLTCSISSASFDSLYQYWKTGDTEIQNGTTYYTVSASAVASPDISDIDTYYEYDYDHYGYRLTGDSVIDETKTYYTLTGTAVQSPSASSLGSYYERTVTNILDEMPITVSATVSGGVDGQCNTNVSIDRISSYFVERPDETTYSGYAGETVYSSSVENASSISIGQEDLIGYLDDTASYRLTVYVYDDLDQMAEDYIDFTVRWAHQAGIPEATVEFDPEYSVVKITPSISVSAYEQGDTVDIYRLSADKPVLIVKGGTFGTTYVDPYPTIGVHGGHRVVTVTANGDFISNEAESDMAWIDLDYEDGDIFVSDFFITLIFQLIGQKISEKRDI